MKTALLNILQSQEFQNYFHRFGYIGVYIYFVTVDQISPIPEEISLVLIGYLAAHGLINPFFAGIFSLLAFFTIDVIYFYLTITGNRLIKKFVSNADSPKMAHYKEEIKNHTPKTLLILSFIPRVRLFSPVIAALAGLKFVTFMIYNGLGLLLFIAVYISIGVVFHKSINTLLPKLGVYQHVIFIAAVVVLVGLSVFIYRKFKGK